MININDIRPGVLLIHKDYGVCLVIDVFRNLSNPGRSIIQACDSDDSVYEGPCSHWFSLWIDHEKVMEYGLKMRERKLAMKERAKKLKLLNKNGKPKEIKERKDEKEIKKDKTDEIPKIKIKPSIKKKDNKGDTL